MEMLNQAYEDAARYQEFRKELDQKIAATFGLQENHLQMRRPGESHVQHRLRLLAEARRQAGELK